MKPAAHEGPFRNDINGLRAYAVIAVLLFHFQLSGFSAGFLGVDIFFVISGFLMTSIIAKGLETGRFSIWKFYMARVRRIVPALMFLTAVLLVLGWFWLPTPDYKSLGSQSAYSSAFVSNIYFWRSAGYFDSSAHEKWLLHTWTLGVEAQFYVLLPIFMIVLWKLKPQTKTLLWGLVVAFLVSLALSLVVVYWKPTAAFYLLPTRGWEFIAGGLVFLVGRELTVSERLSKAFLWTGFALLLLSFIVIDSSLTWPSGWTVLPVLATSLIILAQRSSSVLTAHPVAQWLGDRSYSIYLWHWPVVVALYFAGLHTDWKWIAGGLILSIAMGDLSYRLIETTSRIYFSKASTPKQLLAVATAVALVGVGAVSARVFVFEGRLPADVERVANEALNKSPRIKECFEAASGAGSPSCVFGDEPVAAILMGDSHAFSVASALGDAEKKQGKGALFWGMDGCPTLDGVKYADSIEKPTNSCNELIQWADKEIEKYPGTPLILLSRTSSYLMGPNEPDRQEEAKTPGLYFSKQYSSTGDKDFAAEYQTVLRETACRLAQHRTVYLVRPVPEMSLDVPKTLSRNMVFGRKNEELKITLAHYHERNKLVWQAQDQAAEQCGVKILNPLPYLCDDQYCYSTKEGRPLYFDDDHLSEYGNKFLVPMFEQVIGDQSAGN